MIFAQLTESQVIDRMLAIPTGLQFVLDDQEIRLIVDDIADEAGVKGEDLAKFEALTSFVFIGFLHPEALYDEFVETLGLSAPAADAAVKRLQAEVFQEFGDLLKQAYAPVGTQAPVGSAVMPVPLPASLPTSLNSAPVPKPSSLPTKINPFDLPAKPLEASAKQTTAAPRPIDGIAPPKPTPITSVPASKLPASELPVKAPTPFVLRKETTAAAAAPKFKLDLDPRLFGDKPQGMKAPSTPVPPKPAQLELGSAPLNTEIKKDSSKDHSGNQFLVPPPPSRQIRYAAPKSSIGISAAPLPSAAAKPTAPEKFTPPAAPTAPNSKPTSPAQSRASSPTSFAPGSAFAKLNDAKSPLTDLRKIDLGAHLPNKTIPTPTPMPKPATPAAPVAPYSMPSNLPKLSPIPTPPAPPSDKKPPRVVNFTEEEKSK